VSDVKTDEPVSVEPQPPIPSTYLGDAVYASFDGYQIWLHLNDHRSEGLIALEPAVYHALTQYAERIWRKRT
jgi:hypothetical protein